MKFVLFSMIRFVFLSAALMYGDRSRFQERTPQFAFGSSTVAPLEPAFATDYTYPLVPTDFVLQHVERDVMRDPSKAILTPSRFFQYRSHSPEIVDEFFSRSYALVPFRQGLLLWGDILDVGSSLQTSVSVGGEYAQIFARQAFGRVFRFVELNVNQIASNVRKEFQIKNLWQSYNSTFHLKESVTAAMAVCKGAPSRECEDTAAALLGSDLPALPLPTNRAPSRQERAVPPPRRTPSLTASSGNFTASGYEEEQRVLAQRREKALETLQSYRFNTSTYAQTLEDKARFNTAVRNLQNASQSLFDVELESQKPDWPAKRDARIRNNPRNPFPEVTQYAEALQAMEEFVSGLPSVASYNNIREVEQRLNVYVIPAINEATQTLETVRLALDALEERRREEATRSFVNASSAVSGAAAAFSGLVPVGSPSLPPPEGSFLADIEPMQAISDAQIAAFNTFAISQTAEARQEVIVRALAAKNSELDTRLTEVGEELFAVAGTKAGRDPRDFRDVFHVQRDASDYFAGSTFQSFVTIVSQFTGSDSEMLNAVVGALLGTGGLAGSLALLFLAYRKSQTFCFQLREGTVRRSRCCASLCFKGTVNAAKLVFTLGAAGTSGLLAVNRQVDRVVDSLIASTKLTEGEIFQVIYDVVLTTAVAGMGYVNARDPEKFWTETFA